MHPGHSFRVRIGDENLSFKTIVLNDPLPLGRQFPEAIGARPAEDYVVIAMLQNGDFEDLRPDEPYDLRGRGAEQILVVRSDRTFRLMVDTADLEWPKPIISGHVLKSLAKLPEGYDLYQEVRGGKGHDRLIEDCDLVNLDDPGLERFISVEAETTEGRAQLPSQDDAYLLAEGLEHEIISEGGQTGVVLKAFRCPMVCSTKPVSISLSFCQGVILTPVRTCFSCRPGSRWPAQGVMPTPPISRISSAE